MDQGQSSARGTWLSTFALACFVLLVLRVSWDVIYNVFFHPLSRFPGPVSSKLSRIPYWVANLRGEQIHFMKRLHDKYGTVVRFGPNDLSYIDAQAWKDIYAYQKGRPENPKTPEFQLEGQNGKDGVLPSISVAGIADHARMRGIFSPAFSDRALKLQEPLFRQYADLLITKLLAINGQPADMTTMFNLATFDMMAEFTFGEPLGLLENSKYTSWVQNLIDAVKAIPILQLISYYAWSKSCFELLEPKSITDTRRANFQHSVDRVDKRLEKGSDKPDMWNLVESAGNDKQISRREMYANSMLFMVAGTETTASLLTGLAYLLLVNPDKLELLKKEVRDQEVAAAGLTFKTLADLKYLNACLQEALRVYPPVPTGVPRRIAPGSNGGQIICGRWVPSGTTVSVPQYAAYHSATNFKDPELFVPERWLGDAKYKDDNRDACQPFSMGPRNCLGQNMAWYEMRILLGVLVSRFDMELCEESRGWLPGKAYLLWDKKPLMIRLRPVKR